MLSYCFKFIKNEHGRIMLLWKCSVYKSKKLEFLKEKEARGLLSSLGTRKPLSQIPLLGSLLF